MAMAPERAGIGIRRHFTTEGIHPYDEIEWDTRDARITNFRDGTVAFEQPDVEVPRSWSLNATNILAQKYFRGTLGTPEREWSLRQVADRVVDTITAWGIKDGYFVDAPEAEAFNAELKHLIVTQKAAFNSPVWFNIGVKGVPQQASACQPYDALVSTPDGLRPIGELVETKAVGEKVFDANGLTRIVAVKANGTKPVLRIHTKAGYALDVTPDHLVWRASDEQYGRFVEAGELRPNDKLVWVDTESGGEKQLEVARIEELGEMPVYDIQTESGEYLSGGLRVHNCFILAVDDTMDSILNWYVEEGIIFKGGSGSGINLSQIRSSHERVNGGGTASGPVSFMRGADASAGTIKSGGKTRRAAKMVILNADHPDIEDFIWCKAIEERKARALRDAGFDMDLDGKDSHSTQYQNANNSVRVTDEFMQAVLDDDDWDLNAVTTGEAVRTVKARELFRQIAKSAWECADPGMQFDTTINRWHTARNTGRINGSNPCCFVGDTLVATSDGYIAIELLQKRADAGDVLPEAISLDLSAPSVPQTRRTITNAWIAGYTTTLVEVRTVGGLTLRCTPEHRFLTTKGSWMQAADLAVGTGLRGPVNDYVEAVERVELDEAVAVYDLEVDGTHNFAVASDGAGEVQPVFVHNSEYMHLDNSACNLASINLLRFYEDESGFDVEGFKAAVEVVFSAQEILVGNADYPTEKIAQTSRRFRQLGIGYANLGALLMAMGMPYDSDEGRAWAGAITALMTGHAYETSSRTAARMGPFAGYSENREHMLNVLRMHRDEVAKIDEELVQTSLLDAAQEAWDSAVELGEQYGVRNSQASVIAPTGCLVGGSFIPTERGLVRLRSLGDPDGDQWQDLGIGVQTDGGSRTATKFYVNGLESTVDVTTHRGYRIQGTPRHRVKVVDEATGEWQWRHFADVRPGDLVPLALDQLIGGPQTVVLPPISEKMAWAGEHHVVVPCEMTPELAEFVGYFMGDGSLHSRGLRMAVTAGDTDVVDHLSRLGKSLFGIEAKAAQSGGDIDVCFHSVRLAEWWQASGFAKHLPREGHRGKGYIAHIPDAILHSNDREVYRGFLRGLYEADGCVIRGYPSWTTASLSFSHDVQYLLLALGFVTTRKFDVSGRGSRLAVLRLLNMVANERWLYEIGFISSRKNRAVDVGEHPQSARYDHIPVTRALIDRVAPDNDRLRKVAMMEFRRSRSVTRRHAEEMLQGHDDAELRDLLRFFYDRVVAAEPGDEELTYDLSVPENVTYVANGFISHNTIGLLMDCDTTGLEPDLSLVKMKKLVGGGTMSIVNQTVPRALRHLGYDEAQIAEIIAYIDEHKSILGAPHLLADHVPVFACSMGDNTIHYMGHIRMMAAIQSGVSGSLSKTVNLPEEATVEEVEQLHIDAWRLGLKSVAIYRDNCKVAQPLSTVKKAVASAPEAHDAELAEKVAALEEALAKQTTVVVKQPIRERLPRRRRSQTYHFRVADCEGYAHVGEYEDGRPGELFIKASKQGSTLAGILDAFSISISLGLQHGVPLRTFVQKYTNMRFEPAGMTDDPDLRIATSLLDYIFRRIAVDYMPYDDRLELGVLTSEERTQPTLPGVDEAITANTPLLDEPLIAEPVVDVRTDDVIAPPAVITPSVEQSDAPLCMQCGVQMIRSGSCHACPSCGTTSGCS